MKTGKSPDDERDSGKGMVEEHLMEYKPLVSLGLQWGRSRIQAGGNVSTEQYWVSFWSEQQDEYLSQNQDRRGKTERRKVL